MAQSLSTADIGDQVVSGDTLLLADARTSTERALLSEWAYRHRPRAKFLTIGDPALGVVLREDPAVLVEPMRVTWLPPDGMGRDLLHLFDPRRPSAWLQSMVVRRAPERVRITIGEPATVGELRSRFAEQEGGGEAALAKFVVRQGQLACDHAERPIIGDRYKVPRLIAEQVAASTFFREQVQMVADEEGIPFDQALDYAGACLRELVAVQSPLAIDAFRMLLRPVHASAWTVRVDRASLERLRARNREMALVFLPTHRSYVDPLVLAEVLHRADFPRNHLLGGENMAFWPIGPLGKRAGVVFIRRKFGNDRLYRLALKAYFGHLVAKRFNLEWYIEGGRTRTGKLRPPRYGLLHYLVQAVRDRDQDVLLVPTSICYDRLREAAAMAAEQRGATKRSEGLRWLADYWRAQRVNVGTVDIRFGEPFSLGDALAGAGEGPAQLEKVAFRICEGINRITPVQGTSLVSLVLLGMRDRALTLEQVAGVTEPLLDLLAARGVPGDLTALRRAVVLRQALDALVAAEAVERYDGGSEPVWSIARDGHAIAAFYRNGVVHHLLLRGLVELALVRLETDTGEDRDVGGLVEADTLALRDLLKFEFFFADKDRFTDEIRHELELLDPDWERLCRTPEGTHMLLSRCRPTVAHRTLRSFFDAQVIVARLLVERDPRRAIDHDEFIRECMGIGRQFLLQGGVHGAESISKELFKSALDLAANRDLVDPGRDEVRIARDRWLAETREVIDRLRVIESLGSTMLEEALDERAA
jgi:glycerol-3-phosphate O-acyltransferase